ncbi:AMP-dependent synthetase and ligase [Natrialba taiwanensis DSM 12281]|uniref:AMP-dependent synthetase and ligase n=1 Tax=Natrialba taiwanensis DSM 12281 TaxID=1230458 RepID=M0A4T9_9EURY|nr:AMP-dependent synthetase and ligase [Natrialba taiwanensis DSM 12281]
MLEWSDPYERIVDKENEPFYRWFVGGSLNAAENCIDRHLEERKNQVALRWEGKRGERRTYTYYDLYREVSAVAAALRELGVEEDDVVTIYLPKLPELPITMLACARIGALHNVSSRSTCRNSPSYRSRCSPVLVSVRSITSFSRGSPPTRSLNGCNVLTHTRSSHATVAPVRRP